MIPEMAIKESGPGPHGGLPEESALAS